MEIGDRRTAHPYDEVLAERVANAGPQRLQRGASGYFSQPDADLDPRLFPPGGDTLLPHVREFLLDTVHRFWHNKYRHPERWSVIWLAGSGITHQWAAQRDPGDLDCLIGVDFTTFRIDNPRWQGWPEQAIAEHMNDEFRNELWPTTSNWQGFEVTFYVNVGGADIRDINPYAAYDVTHNTWTVHPMALPSDWNPVTDFPQNFWAPVNEENQRAKRLLTLFNAQRRDLLFERDPARRRNTAVAIRQTINEAANLFEDIHLSRRQAFSQNGLGYKDFYNFRWQAHKRSGVVPALHSLANLRAETHHLTDMETYGRVLTDAPAALTAASAINAHLGALSVRR